MTAHRIGAGWLTALAVVAAPAMAAHADPGYVDPPPPQVGSACSADLTDAMTLLPDRITYVRCVPAGSDFAWSGVQTPFPPNDAWLSYGPPITLHGQGMRNPNVASGQWTATPRDPQATCRVTQTTVVEAGVLATPEVTDGQQGWPLSVEMKPRLFYAELAGNCLWVKD